MNRILRLALLAATCLFSAAAFGQWNAVRGKAEWVKLAQDRMELRLPAQYEWRLGRDGTLYVQNKRPDTLAFKLDLQYAGDAKGPANFGENMVRENAGKLKLEVHRAGDKSVLMETRTKSRLKERDVRNMYLQIGFGRYQMLMSLTVFDDEKHAKDVKRFFETDMDRIVASIRAVPQRASKGKS